MKFTWNGVEKSFANTDYHLYPSMDGSINGAHLVYLFADGTRWTADLHADENGCNLTVDWNKIAVTTVTPPEPTLMVTDVCGTQNDTVAVESEPTEGVADYNVSWNKAHTTATVTAQAADGYRFPEDTTSASWDVAMTNQPCPVAVAAQKITPASAKLANTGSDLSPWLLLGAGALMAGAAFTAGGAARRRRHSMN